MRTPKGFEGKSLRSVLAAIGAVSLFCLPAAGFCDQPLSMAPPIQSYGVPGTGGGVSADVSASSVFNWQEIPANQQVPIDRAVFDQGGYQLYDNAGETIVIPFANNNPYVMKFAMSGNGRMYFVNDGGGAPVLYVPENGYLENATVPGARWFPFSERFHPAQPVFLGIAPSWPAYCAMGWYPRMVCYGGYWSNVAVGFFTPSIGLFFNIGGRPCYGWGGYSAFCYHYPPPYHVTYYNVNIYHYAERPYWRDREFTGYARPLYANRPLEDQHRIAGDDRVFRGAGQPEHIVKSVGRGPVLVGGHQPGGGDTRVQQPERPSNGGGSGHVFRGVDGNDGSDRTFSNEHSKFGTYQPNAPQTGSHAPRENTPVRTYGTSSEFHGAPVTGGATHSFHGADTNMSGNWRAPMQVPTQPSGSWQHSGERTIPSGSWQQPHQQQQQPPPNRSFSGNTRPANAAPSSGRSYNGGDRPSAPNNNSGVHAPNNGQHN